MTEILSNTKLSHSIITQKAKLNIDMTPMVDLGFLLITFFIFSAMLIKPTAMKLFIPSKNGSATPAPAGQTITLILGKEGKLLCYDGFAKNNMGYQVIDLDAKPEQLRERINEKIRMIKNSKGAGSSLTVIIKPGPDTNCKTLVAALDEMTINEVNKYAIADIDSDDMELITAVHL